MIGLRVVVVVAAEYLGGFVIRDGAVPDRRSAEIDEPVRFQIIGVKADLLPLVQRADGPDDRLRSVRQDLMVELVVRLQWPLIRDDAVPVDQRSVQQSDGIRVLLRIGREFNVNPREDSFFQGEGC